MSELTESDAEEIIRQFSEGKSNLHSFFTNVIKSTNTTKTGNLSIEELGTPHLPVRTYKDLKVFCEDVANMGEFGKYFDKISENITSTSLSKEALLLKLAVTIKKELADITPERKKNPSWFKKKDSSQTPQV